MGTIHILPADQIEDLLERSIIGRIACCGHGVTGDGRPYVVPIAYGYDGENIYAHSGPGRKLDFMRAEPRVTFEVDEGIAPDRWRSVIVEATFSEIADPDERARALRTLYPPPDPIPDLGAFTTVFKLAITARSGRYELPDP
jgi:nitroimidazol reductase NimA-like FMN-containing flavoprotein (pyridoxamine 5'-phosphate oxidase superfamily)